MQEEQLVKKEKDFPWLSLAIYALVAIVAMFIDFFTIDLTEFSANPEAVKMGAITGVIVGIIGGFIMIAIQYASIKFPTQWISKEKNVYKNEIWEALFYSSAFSVLSSSLLTYFNFQENLIITLGVSLIKVIAFLFIYFSGQEKEPQIKKAIINVQIIWAVIGFGLGLELLPTN